MDQENRVVVLIDMDCFYCQVEEKLNAELKGKPIAVVQYNPWKGGGIIAVNYIARAQGVTRGMRGDEAKEKCPDIELPSVPCQRGKADISKYREAGKEVARVLQKFTTLLERASIDEAYLDITALVEERLKTLNINTVSTEMMPNTFALGYDSVDEFVADVHTCGIDNIDFDYDHAKRLLVGAVIVSEIRTAVYEETGYRCSAGIAHNKILAKLVCGFNKPDKQTVLPKHSVNILYSTLSVKKVKHLGGKFGDTVCEVLKISKMGELQRFTEKELQARFDDKNGTWLYNIARGIDLEAVHSRFNPKSIGCCKQFRGKAALLDLENLRKWLKDLGDEIEDRLEKDALENNRTPKQMVVSYSTQMPDGRDVSSSRSYNFAPDDELCGELFSNKALELLMESSEGVGVKENECNRRLKAPIKFLGISVGKFEDICEKNTKKILDYFSAATSKETVSKIKKSSSIESCIKTISDKRNIDKQCAVRNFFQLPVSNKEGNLPKNYKISVRQTSQYIQESATESKPTQNVNSKILEKAQNNESQQTNRINNISDELVLESPLDKQESFFTKMLNQHRKDRDMLVSKNDPLKDAASERLIRPVTAVCDVISCGDDTNDTDYSGSTINDEINQSISLFEEDPDDIARVTSMRQLLTTSNVNNVECGTTIEHEQINQATPQEEPQMMAERFNCSECGKSIPIETVGTHADYHFALKLRDEERQQVRKEKQEKTISKPEHGKTKARTLEQSNLKNESIANFLVKIDCNIATETCIECGKRIAIDKFEEHIDFHEAQKLNRELNKIKPQLTGSSVKRKRKSISPKRNKMLCRPIDSFFK